MSKKNKNRGSSQTAVLEPTQEATALEAATALGEVPAEMLDQTANNFEQAPLSSEALDALLEEHGIEPQPIAALSTESVVAEEDEEDNGDDEIAPIAIAPSIEASTHVVELPAPTFSPDQLSALEEVRRIRAELEAAQAAAPVAKAPRPTPGNRPRPNMVYSLLSKPAAWSSTPQIAQLQKVLFSDDLIAKYKKEDGSVKLTEPEMFAEIGAAASDGRLVTSQPPVRIFQYYRARLIAADVLRCS